LIFIKAGRRSLWQASLVSRGYVTMAVSMSFADLSPNSEQTGRLRLVAKRRDFAVIDGGGAGSAEIQLQEALARERILLCQVDELIRQQDVWRKLFDYREYAAGRIAKLTARQREILKLILAGRSNKIIAADTGIARRTVENHRAAIMKKVGVNCLPALARLAFAAGWSCDADLAQ